MRIYSTLLFLLCTYNLFAQNNVGIGVSNPDHRLHVAAANSALLKIDNTTSLGIAVSTDMLFKTGGYYTGAVRTIGTGVAHARLGLFTYASSFTPASLKERLSILDNGNVGIGTIDPQFALHVVGQTAIAGNTLVAGNMSIQGEFNLTGTSLITSSITNNSVDYGAVALLLDASPSGGVGTGMYINAGSTGIEVNASKNGPGIRYGLRSYAQHGETNYGLYANGYGGITAYGIYAMASGGATNYAGYFNGNVISTGSFIPSDRKLKNNIEPLSNALSLIGRLNPATYTYRSTEYQQLQLPTGMQYGLLADELKEVIPSAVEKAIQPAQYESAKGRPDRKISEEISFNAVNYTAIIPVLIAAVKEQQEMIVAMKSEIEKMKNNKK